MLRVLTLLCSLLLAAACDQASSPGQVADTAAVEAGPDAQDFANYVEMIANLKACPDVAAAFETLQANQGATITAMIELNEIPAPPFGEEERAVDLAERFRAIGYSDVRIDDAGNVLARRPGSAGTGTIAVAAHIDTVFPATTDVTVRREGDTFIAPGIGDNSRGLAAMLAIAEAFHVHDLAHASDILFVGSVGEEGLGDLRGVRHLFRGDHGIDQFIAIDGGDAERLVVSAVGSNRYRVTFKGPGGHSYGAFGRAHPHQALARAITEFTERAEAITRSEGAKATFSVGIVGGGTSINSIPFESFMEVDMRSVDPRRLDALDGVFRDAIAVALEVENARRTEDEAMTVDIEPVGKRPAGKGDPTAPLIRSAVAAMESFDMTPRLTASSTDSNIPIWLGVPAVTISRGGVSKDSHSLAESWTAEDVARSEQFALLLILAAASPDEFG